MMLRLRFATKVEAALLPRVGTSVHPKILLQVLASPFIPNTWKPRSPTRKPKNMVFSP